MIKVTVTGWINEVFVGNDKEVEKYLNDLRKKQESLHDLQEYRKLMPIFRDSHLHGHQYSKYWTHVRIYANPPYKLEKFRDRTKQTGLSIKIEKVTDQTDFY